MVLWKQEAGVKVADLARKYAVLEATSGGMDRSEARRQKSLEDENPKSKKSPADQMLEGAALPEQALKADRV